MMMKNSILFAAGSALEFFGQSEIMISGPGQRSFRQLQDFAAEMFNNDPAISKTYTGESWTEEFMEYGCYCNKAMRGGGKPDPTIPDSHESLCLELYSCYKCINIDYDAEAYAKGEYSATKSRYSAKVNENNQLQCLDDKSKPEGGSYNFAPVPTDGDDILEENRPRHVCECDKNFVEKLLSFQKKCLAGETQYCLNDKYRYSNGWNPPKNCHDIGMNQLEHDGCCGTYPSRKAYSKERLLCCDGRLTANNIC